MEINPLVTLHAFLPDKVPYLVEKNSIFAVSKTKVPDGKGGSKTRTLVYLLSPEISIQVDESFSEVNEMWEEWVRSKQPIELTEEELQALNKLHEGKEDVKSP